MIERGFGRIAAPDKRDRRFAIQPLVSRLAGLPMIRHWATGKVLDQGSTPHCVEYSGRQWLATSPVRNLPTDPFGAIYAECQKVDEWPGEDYDGTSVRALFKVLQQRGYVGKYGWAFDNDTVTAWILQTGPIVFGTDWLSGMMDTDEHGFIRATGYAVGGHAYLIKGTNRKKVCPDGSIGAHRICNSWGTEWGDHGYAWLSYRDAERLIARDGECCTAIELKQ